MKTKFPMALFVGALAFHALADQMPAASSAVKSPVATTKQMASKNPVVSGNSQNHGQKPASVGGPAKPSKGTGELAGTAVAHKR